MNFTIQNGWIISMLYLLASYPPWLFFYKKGVKRLTNFSWIKTKGRYYSMVLLVLFIVILLLTSLSMINTNIISLLIGSSIFIIGIALTQISYYNYMNSSTDKLITKGIYKYSRNPIYVSSLLMTIGIIILCNIYIIIPIVLFYIYLQHFIIKEEERFCFEEYGEDFKRYRKNVKRYF